MAFPKTYKILNQNSFSKGVYTIVPIRYEDRFKIMEWRNEQMYHLRQTTILTNADQENYFTNVVAELFNKEKPDQILFSYLKNGECIGYGGLVHINWADCNAEISFIMKTELEKNEFKEHWGIYLSLIEQVAFKELSLHKIFTYAFDLRIQLYEAIEAIGYIQEAVLKEHFLYEGVFKDVIMHSKLNVSINIRAIKEEDKQITFEWANDPVTRENSFNSEPIPFTQHAKWFETKLKDKTTHYFICEVNSQPAGLVRFDYNKTEDTFIIGITIAKNYRGRKLATPFLKNTCSMFSTNCDKRIIAYIKEDNIASKKAFEKAGFKFNSIETVKNIKSLKYEYKK